MFEEKILLIVNPVAGRTAAHKELLEALELLPELYSDLTRVDTEYTGHARSLAQHAAGYDRVLCCGGDGTLNEVISGLAEAGLDIPIGYVASGTTNDLAATLGLPTEPVKAISNALQGPPLPYDLGQMNDELYFDYIASFGAFTDASYATPQAMKNLLGHTAYILWGAGHIWRMRPIKAKMTCGSIQEEDEFIFGSISNSTIIGGMLHLPKEQVKFDDGQYEVLLVRHQKKLHNKIRLLNKLLWKKYDDARFFVGMHTDHISFEFEQDTVWTLDGEKSPPCRKVNISVLPKAVQLVRSSC